MRLLLLSLLVVGTPAWAAAPAELPPLDKMTDCYRRLGGFQLREKYWIVPAEREGRYGFYAFSDEAVFFSGFPDDPVAAVKTRFNDFKGGTQPFGMDGPIIRPNAIAWAIPNKKTVYFWLDIHTQDMTETAFGQSADASGKAFQEVSPQKLAEATQDRLFLAALRNHLVSLILSQSGRYHHAFSHRKAPPSRRDYFDQLDTCLPAMEAKMQEVIQLEKKLVGLLDEVAKSR